MVLPLDQGSNGDVRYDSTHQGSGVAQTRHDAVIITWGMMVRVALEAAQLLESEGLWTYIRL